MLDENLIVLVWIVVNLMCVVFFLFLSHFLCCNSLVTLSNGRLYTVKFTHNNFINTQIRSSQTKKKTQFSISDSELFFFVSHKIIHIQYWLFYVLYNLPFVFCCCFVCSRRSCNLLYLFAFLFFIFLFLGMFFSRQDISYLSFT